MQHMSNFCYLAAAMPSRCKLLAEHMLTSYCRRQNIKGVIRCSGSCCRCVCLKSLPMILFNNIPGIIINKLQK
jgi:hypothetical protein